MSTNLSPSTAVNDQRIVQRVRVVAHTLGPAGPNTSDNHWSIYLLLIGNASIRVNMAAEPGFIDGELRLTSQTYQLTNSAIAHFDFDTLGSPRVADFLRIIYQNRRHIYEMSGGGSGCRYWIWVIVSDWASKGLIATNSGTLLWPELLYLYHKTKSRTPLAMVQGTFNPSA